MTTLSWNEIKSRANAFSKNWADAGYGCIGSKLDAARVAFLFDLHQKVTSLLPPESNKKTKKVKN